MRMNELGKSGIRVSAVGTGTWAMGGDFFGQIDDKQCIDAIAASLCTATATPRRWWARP